MSQWRKRDLIIRLVIGLPLITILLIYMSIAGEHSFPASNYIVSFGLLFLFVALSINSWMHEKYERAMWGFILSGLFLIFLLVTIFSL
ncbi:hypothetical protein NSQ54_06835 [Alkalihalobacillus sp. FSL W8-0930]